MSDFTYETVVQVRFRDLDAMGHVNNVVYATYLEQARRDYFADILERRLEVVASVFAYIALDFRVPIGSEDNVVVATRVPELGASSITMEYEVRTGDAVAVTAETVQVAIDGETGEARSLPAEWRERIEAYEGIAD